MSRRNRRRTGVEDLAGASEEEEPNQMDRLAAVLERVLGRTQASNREQFKAPEFDGKGDVQYFLRQFQDVAETNSWSERATLLHLRAALKGSAQDCGRAATVAGIQAALQARFGLTRREARSRLSTLRRAPQTSMQEHAAEVERLVLVGYGDIPEETREQLALDAFYNSLGNAYLQRHLLAVSANSLEEAVQASAEYLMVKQPAGSGFGVRVVDYKEPEKPIVQVTQTSEDPLQTIANALREFSQSLARIENNSSQRRQNPSRSAPQKGVVRCWGCNKEGHVIQKCPHRNQESLSGNGKSPQQ